MPPFFGRNKSLRVAAVDSQPKSSVGKRRRWRRPRRLRKETTAESEVSPVAFLEEREDASSRTNALFLTTPTLKAVLLLLDPATRRFELLQLEFDYRTARVADLLAQIPVSATEEALRNGTYTGLVGPDGVAYSPSQWLSECWGPPNQVVVALPESLTVEECVCMARPILMVPNVVATVRSVNDDATILSSTHTRVALSRTSAEFLWCGCVRMEGGGRRASPHGTEC